MIKVSELFEKLIKIWIILDSDNISKEIKIKKIKEILGIKD